jgi:hypothetical protein
MIGPSPDVTGTVTEVSGCANCPRSKSSAWRYQEYGGPYNPTANLGTNTSLPSTPSPDVGLPIDKTD